MGDHDHAPLGYVGRADLIGETRTGVGTPIRGERDDTRVYDALASMFLGDAPEDADTLESPNEGDPHVGWSVESLVMGHLPVRARPWASQYAAALSERERATVALVRIGGGYGSVELFGSPKGTLSVAAAPSLESAIASARELASICLVQLDERAQSALLAGGGVSAVTLLVGANSSAVVDAYRAIKSMSSRLESTLPPVRVGVMGADEPAALEAVRKLSDAAEAFLGRRIESTIAIERMGPTGAVSLFGDRAELGTHRIMELVCGEAVDIQTPEECAPVSSDVEAKPVMQESSDIGDIVLPKHDAISESGVRFSSEASVRLVDLIDGLIHLDMVCPYDRSTVLAADAQGALHLLHRVEDASESLLETLEWAHDHHGLLVRASGGALREGVAIECHAFVNSSEQRSAARDRMGDAVRLHTLIAVPAGARWACVES